MAIALPSISVRTAPGSTTTTWTPDGASSRRKESLTASSANFVPAYGNAQRYSAILLTGAHGAAGLGSSGLLSTDKWQTTPEELIDAFIATVAEAARSN